jgi:hypothetical protein
MIPYTGILLNNRQINDIYREYKNLKYNYQNIEKQFELLN